MRSGGREGALWAWGSRPGKKLGKTVWGAWRAGPLTPLSLPQDSDVLLQWVPVEEAGDSAQIFFSKKVGFPPPSTCLFPGSCRGRHRKDLGTVPDFLLDPVTLLRICALCPLVSASL